MQVMNNVICHLFNITRMDGPYVNWKFYSMLTDEVKKEHNSHMLNIGSCGLHILHGAFKDGAVASGWQLDRLFSNLHQLTRSSRNVISDWSAISLPLQWLQEVHWFVIACSLLFGASRCLVLIV